MNCDELEIEFFYFFSLLFFFSNKNYRKKSEAFTMFFFLPIYQIDQREMESKKDEPIRTRISWIMAYFRILKNIQRTNRLRGLSIGPRLIRWIDNLYCSARKRVRKGRGKMPIEIIQTFFSPDSAMSEKERERCE